MSDTTESKYYPYPERPSSVSEKTLAIFDQDPEIQLSSEHEIEARAFEKELTIGEDLGEEKAKGIETIWARKINTTTLYPEYFLTAKGKQSLVDNLNVGEEEINFADIESAQAWLARQDYSEVDGEIMKKLQGESIDFVEEKMVAQFEKAGFENMDEVENPKKMMIVRNPDELAAKIQEYKALKRHHKNLDRQLVQENGELTEVKRVLLGIHRRRLNTLLAEIYPEAVALARQEEMGSTAQGNAALAVINEELGSMIRMLAKQDEGGHRSIARINNFIDGVGGIEEGGDFIALSEEAVELADKLDAQNSEDKSGGESLIEQLGILRVKLENMIVSAEEIKTWIEGILREWDILSKQSDYDPDRPERAEDDLWQVVIDEGAKNVSVGDKQGVVKIPSNFNRKIASVNPTGAVALTDHEPAHILQHENKRKIGLAITEKVGTDRASINFEAGAIAWERESQKEWFGQSRPINPHYLRVIQARLKGGSYKECVLAFFNSYMKQNPDANKNKAAKLAVNRSRRIFRKGGSLESQNIFLTNSQPLVYMEQELLARKLEKEEQTSLLMIGGVNTNTLAELHRIGFLDLDRIKLPKKRPTEIIANQIIERLRS